jgi:uncharacterized protein YjlB
MKKNASEAGYTVEHFVVKDDGIFPNSKLPVICYHNILKLRALFPALYVKKLFSRNNWANSWRSGIFEYHHYHSITHEVLGIIEGETTLLLGGDNGRRLPVKKGDVLIIPAGVAHKNLGKQDDVTCIGAYPDGMDYDMNYGKKEERPRADRNISRVAVPDSDPVLGAAGGIPDFWK